MKIKLVDKYGRQLEEVEYEFDSIMLEGGNSFSNAIEWIKNTIRENKGFQIDESCYSNMNKYLRKYAAFGYVDQPLTINVEKEMGKALVMNDITATSFEEVIHLPAKDLSKRYNRLVGLNDYKDLIQKEASIIIAPEQLEEWSEKFHHHSIQALKTFRDRYPFFIFEGDVGTGKTEFAMTFGSELTHLIKKI
ncbi:hypothetical protein AAHB51_05580 [Bacillus cereus]